MAPKKEKPANQEQQERLDSSKPKKADNLTPEESATAYFKKGNWLLDKFEKENPAIAEAKKKIEEKEKAHIETASQLADYYKHPERQNSQTYSRLLEEYSLSLVELVGSLEGTVGIKEEMKMKIIVFGAEQAEKPTFDISMITGEPSRYQKQKESAGLTPQQQDITVPKTLDEYQALKQKMENGLLFARYNIYLETGDKKYKKYFDEYHKNAPQDETSGKLEHIQQLRVTDPMEAYRQCAKLAKDFPQAKELAADILTRNPIFTEFNNDLAALMRDTQPFRQSIDALIQEIQKNGTPSRELIERWVYPAAEAAKNNSRIAKIMDSPAYQLFLNLKGQNAPSIETMIGGADASFRALGPEVQTAFARMQENILQGFKYCQEVKKTADIALNIKGERAGIGGFTVDALVVAGKTLLAVAGAVTAVACFPATGAVATTVLGGFGVAFGSAVGEATFENDYSGFMPKNFAMNWATGVAFSGAGRIAGAALGSVGGKAAAAIAKGNESWSRSAQEYAEKYIQRMAQRAGSGEAGGFKHLIAEIASETREEFMEDALQRIGQGVAPDHPWLGFAFSLIPSATTTARGTFAKSAGKFSPQMGIEGKITNSGIELTYDPNDMDAARILLQQRGAPPEVLQQFDATGQVDVTQEGVSVVVKPETQGDLEPETETVVRARYEHYETLIQQISSLPAEYRNRAQAIIDQRIASTKKMLDAHRPVRKDNLTFAFLIEAYGKIAKTEESLAELPKDIAADFRKELNDKRDAFLEKYEGDFTSKQSRETTNLIRDIEWIESRQQYVREHPETARFAMEKLGRIPSVKILEQLEPLRVKLISFKEIFVQLESMKSLLLAYPELQIDRGRLSTIEELRKIDAGETSRDSLLSESGGSVSPKIETLMSKAEDAEYLKSRLDLLRKFDQEIGQKISQNQKSEITRLYNNMVMGDIITHEAFKERVAAYERSYKSLSDLPALNPEGREQYSANVALTLENFLVEKIIQKGMDAELITKSIKTKYEETAETAEIAININYNPLEQVIREGKFRTYKELDVQHREKGLFGKTGYEQRRIARDEAMGYGGKFVVGALSSRNGYDEIIGPAPSYGHGVVKLKNERVKGRVNFFEGDSLTAKKNAETINPDWLIRKWDDLQSRTLDHQGAILSKALMELELEESGVTHIHTMYVEAHVVGDVTLDDIASITYGMVNTGQEKTRKLEALERIKAEAGAKRIPFEIVELKAEIKTVEDPRGGGKFIDQLTVDKEVNTGTSKSETEISANLNGQYRPVEETTQQVGLKTTDVRNVKKDINDAPNSMNQRLKQWLTRIFPEVTKISTLSGLEVDQFIQKFNETSTTKRGQLVRFGLNIAGQTADGVLLAFDGSGQLKKFSNITDIGTEIEKYYPGLQKAEYMATIFHRTTQLSLEQWRSMSTGEVVEFITKDVPLSRGQLQLVQKQIDKIKHEHIAQAVDIHDAITTDPQEKTNIANNIFRQRFNTTNPEVKLDFDVEIRIGDGEVPSHITIVLDNRDYARFMSREVAPWDTLTTEVQNQLIATSSGVNLDDMMGNFSVVPKSTTENVEEYQNTMKHEATHYMNKIMQYRDEFHELKQRADKYFEQGDYKNYLETKFKQQLNWTRDEITAFLTEKSYVDNPYGLRDGALAWNTNYTSTIRAAFKRLREERPDVYREFGHLEQEYKERYETILEEVLTDPNHSFSTDAIKMLMVTPLEKWSKVFDFLQNTPRLLSITGETAATVTGVLP